MGRKPKIDPDVKIEIIQDYELYCCNGRPVTTTERGVWTKLAEYANTKGYALSYRDFSCCQAVLDYLHARPAASAAIAESNVETIMQSPKNIAANLKSLMMDNQRLRKDNQRLMDKINNNDREADYNRVCAERDALAKELAECKKDLYHMTQRMRRNPAHLDLEHIADAYEIMEPVDIDPAPDPVKSTTEIVSDILLGGGFDG